MSLRTSTITHSPISCNLSLASIIVRNSLWYVMLPAHSDGSIYRKKIEQQVESFKHVSGWAHAEVVKQILQDRILFVQHYYKLIHSRLLLFIHRRSKLSTLSRLTLDVIGLSYLNIPIIWLNSKTPTRFPS
ncbi:hypothetical protein PGT21_031397 [Puccinia graminis f. sp. tritici]|uniref:Uncharacterized protein n=1 Tax=Puccinia graminis f. sp. tritici TaxID=56615 RepID=A0A5B0QYS2_PUCGR|nr:hypothetical protein PGT21_031397 [Puccinia graminis f. sp. tritici]